MPFSASSFFALSFLASFKPMPRCTLGAFGELDVGIFGDFEPVAPGVEEIEEGALDKARAGGPSPVR